VGRTDPGRRSGGLTGTQRHSVPALHVHAWPIPGICASIANAFVDSGDSARRGHEAAAQGRYSLDELRQAQTEIVVAWVGKRRIAELANDGREA
jgi:hypothetical protein